MIRPDWSEDRIQSYLKDLSCWKSSVELQPLIGGLCNKSYVVTDNGNRYVARIGSDILVHNIVQTSVQTSMKAAADIGVTPAIQYLEPGLAIVDFLSGGVLRPDDMENNEENCRKIVSCLKQLHQGSDKVQGPLTYFWPFQVIRQYVNIGTEHGTRLMDELSEILRINDLLEQAIHPFHAVLTHNDVVPQNLMFDELDNVWLIDWDYGGYGHPMFDLAGVSCNADLSDATERMVFELYYGELNDELWRELTAFKLVLNLREYMWGMVQEVTSELGSENVAASMAELYPDQEAGYEGYTNMNRNRFESNWTRYQSEFE